MRIIVERDSYADPDTHLFRWRCIAACADSSAAFRLARQHSEAAPHGCPVIAVDPETEDGWLSDGWIHGRFMDYNLARAILLGRAVGVLL